MGSDTTSNLNNYLREVGRIFRDDSKSEEAYRPALKDLVEAIEPNADAFPEPSKVGGGNKPDFVVKRRRGNITIGYIETKPVQTTPRGLDDPKFAEQFDRYKRAFDNLLITDYVEFRFYVRGKAEEAIRIAEPKDGALKPHRKNYEEFVARLSEFLDYGGEPIVDPEKLASRMASKAKNLRKALHNILVKDSKEGNKTSALVGQWKAFRTMLIHDLGEGTFANMYAETLAYGLFAARVWVEDGSQFDLRQAADSVPKSNPFLRKLFQEIAGYDVDERLQTPLKHLAEVLRLTNLGEVLKGFSAGEKEDPIIHFYETFLDYYDPDRKKNTGSYYTPDAVVDFMVRSVDLLLKKQFNLPGGLGDASHAQAEFKKVDGNKETRTFHKVQILDPAVGTGTFLVKILRHLYAEYYQHRKGSWSDSVNNNILPRLHGFEMNMAAYAMAHLNVQYALKHMKDQPTEIEDRASIYLTNSLQEQTQVEKETITFHGWLRREADDAASIKRDKPIMVVLGNPPYFAESTNKSGWILDLIEPYKKEPGSPEKLDERNPKWINDDYVKFIRLGEHYIEKNGEGVLAFINNHGFLDNPTFRGMRWHLLKTFDSIYVVNLHGNARKKETAPDGSKDENVFNIMAGVSLNIFVKTGKKQSNELATVFYYDLWGRREDKFLRLRGKSLRDIAFEELDIKKPYYFFVPKNEEGREKYEQGFGLRELFPVNSAGIATARDLFTIHGTKEKLKDTIDKFMQMGDEEAREEFDLGKDTQEWKVQSARKDLEDSKANFDKHIKSINYRPFDTRYTYYTGKAKGFHCRPRPKVMQHFIDEDNIGLVFEKIIPVKNASYSNGFITDNIIDLHYTGVGSYVAPLYLRADPEAVDPAHRHRRPNLDEQLAKDIAEGAGLAYDPTTDAPASEGIARPIDVFDYIYAVLHCPDYRERYKEFLKVDFPKIPYPKDKELFRRLAALGCELRQTHLLQSTAVKRAIQSPFAQWHRNQTKPIRKVRFAPNKDGRAGDVFINDVDRFENVPAVAWGFGIGGYFPAQKWLKDRKDSELSTSDVDHYRKIVVALAETDRLMQSINEVEGLEELV